MRVTLIYEYKHKPLEGRLTLCLFSKTTAVDSQLGPITFHTMDFYGTRDGFSPSLLEAGLKSSQKAVGNPEFHQYCTHGDILPGGQELGSSPSWIRLLMTSLPEACIAPSNTNC